ncbi:MAG: Dabb family protein, partial [Aquirufa sp.]
SRRDFIALASTLPFATSAEPSTKMTFIHHVLFWAKNPTSTTETDQLFRALKALGTLPMIASAHVGKPIVTDFDKSVTEASYTFSVVLVFDSAEKEKEYLYHPLHKKFIQDNMHLWGKVQVIDSEAL